MYMDCENGLSGLNCRRVMKMISPSFRLASRDSPLAQTFDHDEELIRVVSSQASAVGQAYGNWM